MVKKFELITGSSGPDAGAMPTGLERHGKVLWAQVMDQYDFQDVGGREMLGQICHAADMAARCRAHIDKEGELIRTKTGLRENPMLRHELAYRSFVCRALHRLGLDVEPLRVPGRPPGTFNKG